MRLVRRARTDAPPSRLWTALRSPKTWPDLLVYPAPSAPVSRVKLLDGTRARPGGRLQVLQEDKTWVVYEIGRWEPQKRIELVAVREGHGEEEGRAPAVPRRERLLIIPQGSGAEVEWSVRLDPSGMRRLLAPLVLDRNAWADALERRVQALVEDGAEIRP